MCAIRPLIYEIGMHIALLFLSCLSLWSASPLEDIRRIYPNAVNDKSLCKESIEQLKKLDLTTATHLGYLGGLQAIWANHVFSPISKLQTFNEGKANIELAIKKEPSNPELRYIRLSIQQHAPFFLGYKKNIKEDIDFLKQHERQLTSSVVQDHLTTLLKK